MTREEHILTIIAEECSEIAKAASKSLRFGLDHIGPHADEANALLLYREAADLYAVIEMLTKENQIFSQVLEMANWNKCIEEKKVKVEKYLELSRTRGRLVP